MCNRHYKAIPLTTTEYYLDRDRVPTSEKTVALAEYGYKDFVFQLRARWNLFVDTAHLLYIRKYNECIIGITRPYL